MKNFTYLIGIPVLYGTQVTEDAIKSVIDKDNIEVVIVDNGASEDVKDVIEYYSLSIRHVMRNEVNKYVNFAWNQIIEYFLKSSDADYLCIMNSDIIMQKQFYDVLNFNHSLKPDEIYIATQLNDKIALKNEIIVTNKKQEVFEGTAGVNIILSREQVNIIYPIPSDKIKVWFGDNFCYEILRKCNFKTYVLESLLAFHYGSQNVSKVAGISEIIEEDKRNWALYSEQDKKERIDKYLNK